MPHFARAAATANAKWRERERPVAATQGERISRASDVPPAAFPCAGRGLRISVTLHPYRSPPLLATAAAAPFFKASYTDAPTKDPLPGAACSNRGAFQTSLFKKYRPRAPSYKAAAAFSLAARLAM